MEIKRNREGPHAAHLTEVITLRGSCSDNGMDDHKLLSMAMDLNVHLSTSQCPKTPADIALMHDMDYCGMLGMLMYAALGT